MTRPTHEKLAAELAEARAAAVRLMASPDGALLLRYLTALWRYDGPGAAANHGQAGWALAMVRAVEDLHRLRKEGLP